MKGPGASRVAFAIGALLAAAPAAAHLIDTGLGAYYDGIAHLFATPADLLVVVALALWAGQRGTRATRRFVFGLPFAWIAGALASARFAPGIALPLATALSFALAGALVALDLALRDGAVLALAIALGLLHGISGGATGGAMGASASGYAGVASAVFCLGAIIAAEVVALPAGWPRVAVRVAGSWIAATGVLVFSWTARAGA